MSLDEFIEKTTMKTKNIQSLRDVALDFLREAIYTGYYKPGHHLKERELSELLGISTTPIKEALRVLSSDGLVETVPRKGTYVAELVDTSLEEFMMVKAVLEGLAAKLAAEKITDEELEVLEKQVNLMKKLKEMKVTEQLVEANEKFHELIREAAKSPIMFQTLNGVLAFDHAFRKRALQDEFEVEEGFQEHFHIFQAIKAKVPEVAEELMKNHLMRTVKYVLKKQP